MWSLFVALLLALALQPLILVWLRRAQVLDHPTARSSHVLPTLRGGGLAVVAAVLATTALGVVVGGVTVAVAVPSMLALIGLTALGFREDLRGVATSRRLGGQLATGAVAGAAAVLGGAPAWAAFAIAGGVVVYSNAFNFMDGINGISALNAAFAGLAYAAIALRFDVAGVTVIGLAVAGGALGFLPFNFPSARVFLGDSGSYALGGVLAVLAVQCAAGGAPVLLCVAPLSVYLADTGWTLLARARRGASLVTPHREHVYQRASDSIAGSAGAVALTVISAGAVTAIAYRTADVSGAATYLAAVSCLGVLGLYLLAPQLLPSQSHPGGRSTADAAGSPSVLSPGRVS